MNLAECYRILGLTPRATLAEVKESYRRLARQYHPDANPGDTKAHEKFIQLHEAYRQLLAIVPVSSNPVTSKAETKADASRWAERVKEGVKPPTTATPRPAEEKEKKPPRPEPTPEPTAKSQETSPLAEELNGKKSPFRPNPYLSDFDNRLKEKAYIQLQSLLKYKRFLRAIALVEGLAQRLPNDIEVKQWQAITYQRFGRNLVDDGDWEKACIYLKKALRTDPKNRALWAEVEMDFRRMQAMI